MIKKYFILSLLSIAIVAFSGCAQKQEQQTSDNKKKNHKDIVAEINGESLLASEFIDFFNSRPRIAHWNAPGGELDPNQVLQAFIDKIVMIQEAKAMDFHKTEEVLKQKELFERREAVNILIKKYIDPRIKISDEEVLAKIPPEKRREVKFRRVVVLSEDKAKEIEKELHNGASFDDLIRSQSMGEEASNGGYLDFLNPHRGIYPQEVINTIFALNIKEFSPPMKIREGFAIFQPIAERQIPPEDLKPVLDYQRALLFKDRQNDFISDLIHELKNLHQIKIDEEKLLMLFKELKSGGTFENNNNPILVSGKGVTIHWQELVSSVPDINKLASDEDWIRNLLDSILRRRLLILEAEERGLKEDVQLQRKSRRLVEDIISRKLILEEIEKKLSVTEENCREYYIGNFDKAVSYEEIKSKIKQTLMQEKKEKKFKEFLTGLRSKAKIHVNRDIFNELRKSL
ncbi:MAG: peptidylprolyl isomerase [bacterium]